MCIHTYFLIISPQVKPRQRKRLMNVKELEEKKTLLNKVNKKNRFKVTKDDD